MPLQLFHALSEDKQAKIFQAALNEFSLHGYQLASTNKIVKSAGISKGSLFKYFSNKEMLYLDTLDCSIQLMIVDMGSLAKPLSDNLTQVIVDYAELEFMWYINHPIHYKLIKNAFVKDNPMYDKTIQIYGSQGDAAFDHLISSHLPEANKTLIINIHKWVIKGFNESFYEELNKDLSPSDMKKIKTNYINSLIDYLHLLQNGWSNRTL